MYRPGDLPQLVGALADNMYTFNGRFRRTYGLFPAQADDYQVGMLVTGTRTYVQASTYLIHDEARAEQVRIDGLAKCCSIGGGHYSLDARIRVGSAGLPGEPAVGTDYDSTVIEPLLESSPAERDDEQAAVIRCAPTLLEGRPYATEVGQLRQFSIRGADLPDFTLAAFPCLMTVEFRPGEWSGQWYIYALLLSGEEV